MDLPKLDLKLDATKVVEDIYDDGFSQVLKGIRPAKSSTQSCKAKTWCALKFKWAPVLAF